LLYLYHNSIIQGEKITCLKLSSCLAFRMNMKLEPAGIDTGTVCFIATGKFVV